MGQFRIPHGYRFSGRLKCQRTVDGKHRLEWHKPLSICISKEIQHLFKLYPWEWIWEENFSQFLKPETEWIEPCWKMLLSNKAPLIELWKRFPNHPLLLETHAYDAQAHYAGEMGA